MAAPFSPARLVSVLLICTVAAAACFAVCVAFGERPLSWDAVRTAGSTDAVIFQSLRLPRVTLAAIVGLALGASGSMLQALTRNPLADPFVLGVSGGAALGATVALALGLSATALPGVSPVTAFALLGALGATALVLAVGRAAGGSFPHATLLAGVIFNAFALAAITFIRSLVSPDRLGEILFWLTGSLTAEDPSSLAVAGLAVSASVGAMMALSPRLNLLSLGDEDAQSLGLNVGRTRVILLVFASLSVAASVSLSGLVAFVGLLVPHFARLLFGADQRLTLPASALLGASFLMLADLAARLLFRVFNSEPPVGAITALLGAPLFLLLMVRQALASR